MVTNQKLQLGPHTGTKFISPKSPHFYNACITVREFCDSCPILHDVCFVLEIQIKKVKKVEVENGIEIEVISRHKKKEKEESERKKG